MTGIPQPGVTVTGEYHAPVTVAIRAFSARSKNAARLRHLRRNGVLTAKAVLQQDQFGTGREARRQPGHGLLGIVGFAGHQQAVDRLIAVSSFAGDGIRCCFAVLHQRQAARSLISLQARRIPHDQPDRHPGPRQTRGP
ncbi:hypothetical protein D3C84_788740 [compost metagenome]